MPKEDKMAESTKENSGSGALLASLALALVDHPGATLKDIAKAAGVSKATLYRYSQTREQLLQNLTDYSMRTLSEEIERAELETRPVQEALRVLIDNYYRHPELTAFLMFYWKDVLVDMTIQKRWTESLDRFFLRCQKEGFLRIDISASELMEIFIAIIIGLVDAERRGRVARGGLGALTERFFLQGAGVARD